MAAGTRAAKKSVLEMENGLVSLPAKLCFVCGRSVCSYLRFSFSLASVLDICWWISLTRSL